MHHFFINKENKLGNEIIFAETDKAHMVKVLRLKPGETVSASDGAYFYNVFLTSVGDEVRGDIKASQPALSESPLQTILVQGIAKGEKMDYIIQKATELGVNQILPVETTYSIVKLDSKKKRERTERWQKIAHEAAKQSKRSIVPHVFEPVGFDKAVAEAPQDALKMVLWENEENLGIKTLLNNASVNKIVLFIGPEGGFSQEEVNLALLHNAHAVTLGKRILRTETAGIAALSIVQFALGDLGGTN